MPESATEVHNINLGGMADNVSAYIGEIKAMASGDLPHISPADRGRVQSYLDAMKAELDYVNGFPQLDLPHHDPKIITLNPVPDQREFENQFLTFYDRLFRAYHREVTLAVSAKGAAGITVQDYNRLDQIISAGKDYDANYVAATNPVDSPETGGSTGV